jgi:NAD+ kinase
MNRQQRRRVLLLLHPRRLEAVHLGHEVIGHLTTAGVDVVVDQPGAELLGSPLPVGVHLADPEQPSVGCELVLVLGGDGHHPARRRVVPGL